MNIAVTGADGFIGSHLVKNLMKIKKIKVYPFKRNRYSLFRANSLKGLVKNKDIIVHLAGVSIQSDLVEMYKINVLGTVNLLEAARLYGKKDSRFVFASSFAVYEAATNQLLDELKTKILPRNHYGISKFLAEEIIKFYGGEKLKFAILRLANVYGPGAKPNYISVVATFVDNVLKDRPIIINGDGRQARDFIFVDDVVRAITAAINYPKNDSFLVNICSGKATTLIDLVKLIEEICGKKANIKYNPLSKEEGYWIGSTRRAWEKIHFKAKVDLRDGLEKTINWNLKSPI